MSVIDRLEFDPDLRLLDPLEDLCFLWLECIRLGAPLVAEGVVRRYLAMNGTMSGQEIPPVLADLYLGHRALTRAKLAAWRLVEPGADRARWQARVHDYVTLASNAMSRAVDEPIQPASLHSQQFRKVVDGMAAPSDVLYSAVSPDWLQCDVMESAMGAR